MSLTLALVVAGLVAGGVFLVLQRELTRIVLGFALLGHGANLLLLLAGGRAGRAAFIEGDGPTGGEVDPLPQALALTSIVITFAATTLLLALAYRSWEQRGSDEVEDDLEDRRIARLRDETDADLEELTDVLADLEGDTGPGDGVADVHGELRP
ncbi:MAG: NADH-quinone oxidoreductase subunit K [Acidimicrobiales bacterium]|jgi:multicomponent Na+:H+ antiporter subunit C|nr:NADH-quinone oxidoreductase subunit K [Acidimicrobiales bacterium]